MELFAVLGQWLEAIARFFPHWVIVKPTEGYVKFVRGARVVVLPPGVHWYWPCVTELDMHPTVRQTVDLRAQTVVTTDDKTITVGGLVVYEVTDIQTVLTAIYHADEAVKDIALSAIHDVVCQKSWTDLKVAQQDGTLDREMRAEAHKNLRTYGLRVVKVALTDLAPCRVLRTVQAISESHT